MEWLQLVSLAIGLAGGLIGAYVGLRMGLIEVKGDMKEAQNKIAKLDQWTHDKEMADVLFRRDEYMRAITDINTKLWPLAEQVKALDKNIDGVLEWKVADAYLPGAVDEHERRLNRIESKIFNGPVK